MNDIRERHGIEAPDWEGIRQEKMTAILKLRLEKKISTGEYREQLDRIGLTPHVITSFMLMTWNELGLGVGDQPATETIKAMSASLASSRRSNVLPFKAPGTAS